MGKRIGAARFRIAGGKSATVRVKLARKAHGRVRLAVSVKATDAAGNSRTTVSKLALKAR